MKKTIIIALLLSIVSTKLPAQLFHTYTDTANYLVSEIENKKNFYIGKPFSILCDSLKIKPVFALFNYGDINLKDTQDYTKTITFYFNHLFREFSQTHLVTVYWYPPLPPYNTVNALLHPANGPIDMVALFDLYRPLIVKDVIVKDYNQDFDDQDLPLPSIPPYTNRPDTIKAH